MTGVISEPAPAGDRPSEDDEQAHAVDRLPRPREFLSTGEVARLFGVSPSAVTRWARTGVLKAVRTPGGHYRFRASTLRRASIEIPDEPQRLD